jgi:hypothetical protein
MNASPARRKRRRISPDTWSSISSALSRQHSTLKEECPDSPRIKPSLAKLRFLVQEVAR